MPLLMDTIIVLSIGSMDSEVVKGPLSSYNKGKGLCLYYIPNAKVTRYVAKNKCPSSKAKTPMGKKIKGWRGGHRMHSESEAVNYPLSRLSHGQLSLTNYN